LRFPVEASGRRKSGACRRWGWQLALRLHRVSVLVRAVQRTTAWKGAREVTGV